MLPASRSHQTGSVELCEIVVKSKDFICKSTLPNDEPMKAVTRKIYVYYYIIVIIKKCVRFVC